MIFRILLFFRKLGFWVTGLFGRCEECKCCGRFVFDPEALPTERFYVRCECWYGWVWSLTKYKGV